MWGGESQCNNPIKAMSMVVITTYMPTLMRVPEREGLKAAAAAHIGAVLLAGERGGAAAAVQAGELRLDADVACKLFISSGADPRPRSPVTHPYEIRSGAKAACVPPRRKGNGQMLGFCLKYCLE